MAEQPQMLTTKEPTQQISLAGERPADAVLLNEKIIIPLPEEDVELIMKKLKKKDEVAEKYSELQREYAEGEHHWGKESEDSGRKIVVQPKEQGLESA